MVPSFASLLPPIVVLFLAFTTRKIIFSLICGVLTATFIATNYSPLNTVILAVKKIWANSELGTLASWDQFMANSNLFIAIFLFAIGIIVTLVTHSGGTYAYGNLIKRKVKTKRGAESATLALSSILFVDDYFNSLTVGSVMHHLTDHFKVPHVKLALLVDSMSAPLCILFPISSWIAVIIMELKKSGVSEFITPSTLIVEKPFLVYLQIIPYIFYSLIIVSSVWFIVRRKISFGGIKRQEMLAKKTGNLFGGKPSIEHKMKKYHEANKDNHSIIDFIFPLALLFFSILFSILYTGHFCWFGGCHTLIEAFQASEVAISLFLGSMITLVTTTIFFFIRKKINFKDSISIYKDGIYLMVPAIVILILAWTLGDLLTKDLLTGQYLAQNLTNSVSLKLLPFMFFVVASITSFAIGSSWGAMAILFPIAIPMLVSLFNLSTPTTTASIPLFYPVLGAILSGAVYGDHTSPTSETTIMSATSCCSYFMDHVQTQLLYSAPALISTAIAFLISGYLFYLGFWQNMLISFGSGLIICLIMLKVMDMVSKRKETAL